MLVRKDAAKQREHVMEVHLLDRDLYVCPNEGCIVGGGDYEKLLQHVEEVVVYIVCR